MTKYLTGICFIIFSTLLSSCGGAFSGYSDAELRKAYRDCDYNKLSPAGAQRCNNIKKECDSRRKDKGFRC
ncbi:MULTISPECIES: hypothetical protein [unclassified Oleiphilus]|jgi:hypothetical protein|uniref:hypothetical protein n=1 Tax=unclassified Oleiphilus TaxID=2631174 RepID=UPI0007C35CAE|nr:MULTISPECIES: hypothetical protein [unclassified Oleiphilus]KZY43288.1 hypothetical protein A3732_02125 [Oleiphilus sp. HI0050]KZY75859.1 hypothetical protein A3740_14320 [Oleiphilus sp. HI0068]KZY81181.1 hypothetical protein A3741_04710 [Oleiphilus sp. HI0069]KZY84963.1 hypothetical protein A3743_20165 [Oleiphilus sp. HI0072]KZZ26273.1 hypothetical protein A3752_23750 [Oleiphilus sp. HI0081]KZZ44595.1 hypothetical protein A3755_20740 [Oleiphilus sp. HI0085]